MSRDGTLFKKMSKLASFAYQRKCAFFYLKVFCKSERQSSSLIESMSEGRKKALMGLEKHF
jgi:hypothetical protein